MNFELYGQVNGHESGDVQNVYVARDKYDQAQVLLTTNGATGDLTTYVVPISPDVWDSGPQDEILAGLHRFPGFESLEWKA